MMIPYCLLMCFMKHLTHRADGRDSDVADNGDRNHGVLLQESQTRTDKEVRKEGEERKSQTIQLSSEREYVP